MKALEFIYPSIYSGNHLHLYEELKKVENGGFKTLHVDIQDGVCSSEISFGIKVLKSLSEYSKMDFDLHLMLVDVERFLDKIIGIKNIKCVTFHPSDVRYPARVIFIITPQADRTYSFLASMLYSQLFETLYFKGEQQKANGGSEALKIPVRCLMDEFANIGEIPEFPSKLSTMRKYNISATIILQDISQIESMYKDDWKTLMGNCSTYIFLGTQEPNTLKYFSEMLGKMTVTNRSRGMNSGSKGGSNKNFQQTSREVMTPDELGRMDSMMEIVFTQNQRPIMDKKYAYEKHPLYELTGDAHDENAFLYNQMPEFDNTKTQHFSCLLKARAEAAKIRKQSNVTDSKNTKELIFPSDKNEAFDKIIFDRKQLAKIKSDAVSKITTMLMKNFKQPFPIIKLENIQTQVLMEVAEIVAVQTQKEPFILFSDIKGKKMTGVLYGKNINCQDYDQGFFLRKVKHNDNLWVVSINTNAFELYQETIQEKTYE